MNTITQTVTGLSLAVLSAAGFAAGNLSVSREVVVDRAPATVWKLLGEFNALDVWLPPVQSSTTTDARTKVGSIRVLDLGNNASVTEQLLAYDGTGYSYSYAFVKSPLPVKNYVATIELSAAGAGKTLIKWSGKFDASGAPDDKAKEAILGIYDVGLAKVASIFRK